MTVAVIIPFREREGGDPLRVANLARVADHWAGYGCEVVVASDGRSGDEQFNRSIAYNRAVGRGLMGATTADMLIFSESDLIVSYAQVDRALRLAKDPGMVIPFSWFMALSEADSVRVRAHEADPADCDADPIKGHRGSIGAINVMSRSTYDRVGGYDESFEGAWYDDDAMKIAFDTLAGPTRWVEGSAFHLYHLSGGRGEHLTDADRAATAENRRRFQLYRKARTPEQIRSLIHVG